MVVRPRGPVASPVSPLLAASLEAPGPRGMVPGTLGSPSRRPGPGAWLLPDFATEEPLVCHLPQAGSDRGHSWYTDRPRTGACAACAVAIFKIATQGVHWSDTGQTCIEVRNILNANSATEVWMQAMTLLLIRSPTEQAQCELPLLPLLAVSDCRTISDGASFHLARAILLSKPNASCHSCRF